MQITPTILEANFEQVMHKLFLLEGLTDRVQIDVCDGAFGLEKTWMPYKEESLPEGFEYEFDMMVNDWRKFIPRVIALGAKRVVAHIDNFEDSDVESLVGIAKRSGVKLGLCVSNDKKIEGFARMVNLVADRYGKVFVQLMGIKRIGAQGQPFDEDIIERIWYIKKNCRNILIQVDGSMNPETILRVKNAGADCAVVGSYIFAGDDVKERIENLRENFR